ncbi:MAG: DUF4145 domain-containing protein [Caulobacteraceae bacterium]|nr:DUF4145 domain-containing protein [Caulobacteraceae bacterium]
MLTITAELRKTFDGTGNVNNNYAPLKVWTLQPQGTSKVQPDYIPKALVEDYTEACLIRDLSPKASATLARRCLQGMIRDFCGISKNRLVDEISALRTAVDAQTAPRDVSPDSLDAIDAVRKVGNIGAHMESDINNIVPVEPVEAQLLIELVESLFDEWYVARHKRQQRFAAVAKLAESKKATKVSTKPTAPPSAPPLSSDPDAPGPA